MNSRDSGSFCGVVGDTPAMGHSYANSWDTLHEQVNSSLTKCKLEYTKFRGMSAAIESTGAARAAGSATSGSGAAVISTTTTVWNPTSKRDVTKNKIENKCLLFAEMANRKSTTATASQHVSASKREPERGSLKTESTSEKKESDDNYEGGGGRDEVKKIIIVASESVQLPRLSVPPPVISSSVGQTTFTKTQKRDAPTSPSVVSTADGRSFVASDGEPHLGITFNVPTSSVSMAASAPSARNGQTGSSVAVGTNYCCRCGESITSKDLLPVSTAAMAEDLSFHARCFRCQFCDRELIPSDADRKQLENDGRVYCSGHGPPLPDRGNAAVIQQQVVAKATTAATYNGQIRGPHAGKAAQFDSSALSIQAALKAPRSAPKPAHNTPPHDVIKSDVIGLRYF